MSKHMGYFIMNSKQLANKLKVSEMDVESVYASMHKTTEAARQINCRACGFNTCEQMVAAILVDIKCKEDCAHYLNKNLESETSHQQVADDLAAKVEIVADMMAAQMNSLKYCVETLNSTISLFVTLSMCLEKINRKPD